MTESTTNENQLKTLTMKNIGIDIPVGGGKYLNKLVMAVHAVCTGYFYKATQYGENIALVGEFNAINPETGECYFANVAYLPADFAEMIKGKLDARKDQNEIVEFSAGITPVTSAKGARGYTFVAQPIQTAEVYNRRRAMLDQLMNKVQALPASQKVAQIEDKSKAKKSA